MGDWGLGDLHAAFVALFILLLTWFATFIPKLFSTSMTVTGGDEDRPKRSRSHHAYSMARDAVLLLTSSLLIAFAGKANQAATNALSYIFMALYMLAVALAYWTRKRSILTTLQLLAYTLMLALVIMSFGTASGRGD